MIDIGVNFHSSQLKGLAAELLSRAAAAGVTHILATGTSLHASELALSFARAHERVWATAGTHPHDAKHWDAASTAQFEAMWADAHVVAVGECGLDYNRMFSPREAQRIAFEAQIAAAVRTGKPLFLHCRDAFDDFEAMLRDALRVIPADRLHLETDAPYLRPKNAGKTRNYNEPALLPFVAKAVAELKGMDVAALSAQATANSRRLFKLPD